MSPQEAATLQPGDIVVQRGQLFRIAQVGVSGGQVRLIGKTYDQIISPLKMDTELVWRAANVPPDVVPGWLSAEQEAQIRAIIAERKERETGKEWS